MKCIFCEGHVEDYCLGMHKCTKCGEAFNPFLLTKLVVRDSGQDRIYECHTRGIYFCTKPYIREIGVGNKFEARIGVNIWGENQGQIESPFSPKCRQYAYGKGITPWAATYAMMKQLETFCDLARVT